MPDRPEFISVGPACLTAQGSSQNTSVTVDCSYRKKYDRVKVLLWKTPADAPVLTVISPTLDEMARWTYLGERNRLRAL